jgi:hypothetical protein
MAQQRYCTEVPLKAKQTNKKQEERKEGKVGRKDNGKE